MSTHALVRSAQGCPTNAHSPPEVGQIDLADLIPLQAELDEAVHLLQTVDSGNSIAIGTKLSQVSEALQFYGEQPLVRNARVSTDDLRRSDST